MTAFGLVVYDDPAAEGLSGRGTPQNIMVAAHGHDWVAQFQLNPAFRAGREFLHPQQPDHCNRFTCAHKELDLSGML